MSKTETTANENEPAARESAPVTDSAGTPTHPASESAGAGQVQATLDAEEERGYRGVVPDPTPDHAYTVAGVLAGEPTPETAPRDATGARDLGAAPKAPNL